MLVGDRTEVVRVLDPVVHVLDDRSQRVEVVTLELVNRIPVVVGSQLSVALARHTWVFVLFEHRHVVDPRVLGRVAEPLAGPPLGVRLAAMFLPRFENRNVAFFGVWDFVGQRVVCALDEFRFSLVAAGRGDCHWTKKEARCGVHQAFWNTSQRASNRVRKNRGLRPTQKRRLATLRIASGNATASLTHFRAVLIAHEVLADFTRDDRGLHFNFAVPGMGTGALLQFFPQQRTNCRDHSVIDAQILA